MIVKGEKTLFGKEITTPEEYIQLVFNGSPKFDWWRKTMIYLVGISHCFKLI